MKLEESRDNLVLDVAFWMLGLKNPTYPIEQLGDLSLEVSEKLRAVGIILLLVGTNTDGFYHNLIRSGRARVAYLQRLQAEGINDDHHQGSGRYEPLLDAIAAGDFGVAERIVDLSPLDWLEGHEYEDDYCYAQLLHRLIRPTLAQADIPILLARFETYLDGKESARLDVCRALTAADQAAFDAAFEALLDEREAQIAADKKRGQMEEPQVIAERQVFVEGLAVLRLAELKGLTTRPENRHCPSLARMPMAKPFPGE